MFNKEEDFDILCHSTEMAQFYLGSKLVEENQEFDFSWNAFPKKAAHLISMICAIKIKNKYKNIDIKAVENKSYQIIEDYLNDKINHIFENIFLDFLPFNVLNKNQLYVSFIYSVTKLNSIKSILDLAIEKKTQLTENELNTLFTYLCYKSTTALSIINNDKNNFHDINMPKGVIKICTLNSQNYAIYLIEQSGDKIKKIKEKFPSINIDVFNTINDYYNKQINKKDELWK